MAGVAPGGAGDSEKPPGADAKSSFACFGTFTTILCPKYHLGYAHYHVFLLAETHTRTQNHLRRPPALPTRYLSRFLFAFYQRFPSQAIKLTTQGRIPRELQNSSGFKAEILDESGAGRRSRNRPGKFGGDGSEPPTPKSVASPRAQPSPRGPVSHSRRSSTQTIAAQTPKALPAQPESKQPPKQQAQGRRKQAGGVYRRESLIQEMAGPANRRVKGKRISRSFVIGTEAWPLTDKNRPSTVKPGDTTGWRVYVRPVGMPRLTPWLKKVVFGLHETFPNPLRAIENPDIVVPLAQKGVPGAGTVESFELTESGYGGFTIAVRLYFVPTALEKWQARSHFLQLEPYGDDAMRALQEKEGIVRSEQVEVIEFNEPTESLWDRLTSEDQFMPPAPTSGKGSGKGKGKSRTVVVPDDFKANELPERPSGGTAVGPAATGTVWSKEAEDKTVAQLEAAEKQAQEQLMAVLRKRKDVGEILAKIQEHQDVEEDLLQLAANLGLIKRPQ